ncbi:hypothetical protein ACJX0J_025190 [Zea mays]
MVFYIIFICLVIEILLSFILIICLASTQGVKELNFHGACFSRATAVDVLNEWAPVSGKWLGDIGMREKRDTSKDITLGLEMKHTTVGDQENAALNSIEEDHMGQTYGVNLSESDAAGMICEEADSMPFRFLQ